MPWITSLDKLLTSQRLRYPWFIGGALWLGWLVSLLLGSGVTDLAGHLIGTDFVAFYSAGKILWMGQGANLYDLDLTHQIQQDVYGFQSENFNPYLNPPYYAALFIPFAWLPYSISALIWLGLNVLFLWLSLRLVGVKPLFKTFLLILTWLPAFSAISFGQNAFLSLLILGLVYSFWRQDKHLLAGLCLSLLLYKPQLIAGVALLWLLEWRTQWKSLGGLILGAAAIGMLNFGLMPAATAAYLTYAQKSYANLMHVAGFPFWNAHALGSFWLMLLPGAPGWLPNLLYSLCALLGLFSFVMFWRKWSKDREILFAAAVLLTLWITPYLMVYDWVLFILPAWCLWAFTPNLRTAWRVIFAVFWVTMLLSSVLTFLQLQVFGFAVQISLLVLAWGIYWSYRLLLSTEHGDPAMGYSG